MLPDDDLLRRLAELLAGSRHTEADLVACIGEVDARRLYAREATPSMFVYCTERLHLSEAEACLRIAAARACRQHPVILEMLADGRLHLSAVARIAPHLTLENKDVILRRATHRTKREIDELVAELSPQPDVPASIRKLPAGRIAARSTTATDRIQAALERELRPEGVESDGSAASPLARTLMAEQVDEPGQGRSEPRPEGQEAPGLAQRDAPRPAQKDAHRPVPPSGAEANPEGGLKWIPARPSRPAAIECLSPSRYKVEFTASETLRAKIVRLQALMRSSVPDGDLAVIIDAAVTEKLERLEARRFGRTRSPRKTVCESETAAKTRHVPAAVRRAVGERDEFRCRYVDTHGNRCTARARLEYHHRIPFGMGGDHRPESVSLLCKAHNRLMAEVDYGRDAVTSRRG